MADEEPVTRREFEARLAEVRVPPLADPTANVLSLVDAAIKRLDDLSDNERRHRTELREIDAKYRDAQLAAEARRLDALLAAQNNAVILANTRAELTAAALAERVDTAAKTLAAEAGSKEQRIDNRTTSQWTLQQVLVVVGLALGALYFIVTQQP